MMPSPLVQVGFVGMTHLSICSAVAAAERGFNVLCFDPDQAVIANLHMLQFPIYEPELAALAEKNAARISFTSDAGKLASLTLCFVAPDVPTGEGGRSNLGPITRLIGIVDARLAPDASMIVLSQVPPGFTRKLARPADRRFCQVETLVFGQAMKRAIAPERLIVGCADPAVPLPVAYQEFLEAFGCPILPMRYESAELAKIAINMFLVSSISTTNTLAELCEEIGADWREVVPALRLDRRIGQHAYLAPGLGIGGGNLERDLTTFTDLGEFHGTDLGLIAAWIANSVRRRDWVFAQLQRTVLPEKPAAVVAMLGLAYKEDTASTRNSAAVSLLAQLPAACTVRVFDPMVIVDRAWRPAGLVQATDALDACLGADVLVIMTPWAEFSALDIDHVVGKLRGKRVIDPYGMLDPAACHRAGLVHFQLGRGPVS